jgi:membrane associated rhomboid family serine protease
VTSADKAHRQPRKTWTRGRAQALLSFLPRAACGGADKRVIQAPVSEPSHQREPVFNIPGVVLALLAVMAAIHAVRTLLLSPAANIEVLLLFAFDPIRYGAGVLPAGGMPGGFGAQVWTFVTYAFLHANWTHFGVNAIWFLAFGTAVARRFGPARFLVFFAVTAAAGAIAHLFAYGGQDAPVIGASAAISGTMAAAMRFAFQRGGPLSFWRTGGEADYRVPAVPLMRALREPAVIVFLVVWFGLNFLFGLWASPLIGQNEVVAWQAHIGGFLAGLLLFPWFDPVPALRQSGDRGATRN